MKEGIWLRGGGGGKISTLVKAFFGFINTVDVLYCDSTVFLLTVFGQSQYFFVVVQLVSH